MKTLKIALLGGAALAVLASGAQADDLSALKAQIESLNGRIATLEAAPAVPAGYSLLTIAEGDATVVPGNAPTAGERAAYGTKATIIGIVPTADAPAAASMEWSGYARAAAVYNDDGTDGTFDVKARGQLKAVGKTDTAVGEVGALVQLRGDFGARDTKANVTMNEAWGWWGMTPELTLGGGYTGSLGNIGYGYDGACNCYYTDSADVAMNPGDAVQMRLSYASGPISFGIAVEDETAADSLAGAAEIKYSGDTFNGEVSGYANDEDAWRIGAGVGAALGDMASLSMGAQMGAKAANDDFWTASILASVTLGDQMHAEAAFGHTEYDDRDYTVDAVLAGVYYDPVAQLTIGVEAEWISDESAADDTMQIDLVTVFRF